VWSATYACIQVNAGNSIVFALMGLFCILSPIFVNWIGVKKTLIAGTLGWTVYSAALYQNNRYGTEWFVLLGAVICGLSAGLYWAAEGAIVLSYPEHAKRGRYLALWLGFKNSGQVGVPSFADAKNSD
jgi:MFS family permease